MLLNLIHDSIFPYDKFKNSKPVKTFIVLGMHRSATSMISRALHLSQEVWMGDDLYLGGESNPRGHFELIPVINLNNEILNEAGGSWDNPPMPSSIRELKGKFDNRMKKIILDLEKTAGKGSIGIKDPRMCLTIELWEPFFKNPHYIVTYRSTSQIAKSLTQRNGMTTEKAVKLTNEYNTRIMQFISSRY
jgi:hypothetical protein